MLELEGVNTFRGPAQILREVSLALGDGVLYVSAKDARLYALTAGP